MAWGRGEFNPGGKELVKVGFLPGHTQKCPLGSGTDGLERELNG